MIYLIAAAAQATVGRTNIPSFFCVCQLFLVCKYFSLFFPFACPSVVGCRTHEFAVAPQHNLLRSLGCLGLGSPLFLFLDVCFRIFKELSDDASSDSFSSLTESEALSLEDGQRVVKFHFDCEVVAWHSHSDGLGQCDVDGAVSRPNEALRAVPGEEWLGAATFVRLQHVDLALQVSAHAHAVGLREAHATLDLFLEDTTEEHTDIITSLGCIQLLVECLNTRDSRDSMLALDSNHVHLIVDLRLSLFNSACGDDTSSSNANRVID